KLSRRPVARTTRRGRARSPRGRGPAPGTAPSHTVARRPWPGRAASTGPGARPAAAGRTPAAAYRKRTAAGSWSVVLRPEQGIVALGVLEHLRRDVADAVRLDQPPAELPPARLG